MSPRCMKRCRPVSAGVDDPKHGFSEAALAAVMAAFDTHPEAGKFPMPGGAACAGLRGMSL